MNWIIFPFFALVLGFYVAAAHNLYLKNVPMKLVLTSFMLDFVKLVIVAILPIGNTAKALNVIASIHNVPFENITNRIDIPEARGILKILGGDLIELPGTSSCPDPTDPYDPIVQIEEKVAKNPHYYHTSQYTNLENPKIHHDTTGKEISDDLGKVDYFFGALGTTGSSRGIIEYLQEQNPELKKIGIISKTGGMIPGIRNEEEMMEVRNIPKRII